MNSPLLVHSQQQPKQPELYLTATSIAWSIYLKAAYKLIFHRSNCLLGLVGGVMVKKKKKDWPNTL